MPRQNRVDPFGDLHAVDARGMFTGNRGCLVDCAGRMVRRQQVNRWIICRLEYRGWRHPVAAPNRWTPLFFLDEAVALAAGHRPCATCRNAEYRAYRDAATAAQSAPRPLGADQMDALLRPDRRAPGRGLVRGIGRQVWTGVVGMLPAGAVVRIGGEAHLLHGSGLRSFGFDRWGPPAPSLPDDATVEVLTPRLSIEALQGGYRPTLHDSVAPASVGPPLPGPAGSVD